MDAMQTHGAFSWSELTTTDPDAAASFYGELLGWRFETVETGGGRYRMVKLGERAVAGILGMAEGAPAMPAAWAGYVTVDNLEGCIARVEALGGEVVVAATEVPGIGRYARIADPQGATLNLITYEPPTGGP